MRQVFLCLALLIGGCVTVHEITVTAKPPDANILIDGENRGQGPIVEKFRFDSPDTVHSVTAQRLGYADQTVKLGIDYQDPDLFIALGPQMKRLTFYAEPVPAIISVDGKPLTTVATGQITADLQFTVDAQNQWTTHVVTAERTGWAPAQQTVHWVDTDRNYLLRLGAQRKDLHITTTPTGAQVFLNDELLGTSPLRVRHCSFPISVETMQPLPRTIKAVLPGYPAMTMAIGWDDGQVDYHVDLVPNVKTVRLTTSPPGGTITLEGQPLPTDSTGTATAKLVFLPIDGQGDLKTYSGVANKKTADSEWFPQPFTIAWDSGQTDYTIPLKEIMTRPVPLLRLITVHTDDGWQVEAEQIQTLAMKATSEPAGMPQPKRISNLPPGVMIDSLAVSPDGSQVLFDTLTNAPGGGPRARLRMIKTDGTSGETQFGDDQSLDVMPAFTPDGSQIVFSSNRGGKRMSIWEMSAVGDPGVTQVTSGEENDLWPVVDSDAKPRLFYQAMVDNRTDARLYTTVLGATSRTDLGAGQQPRISPMGDEVLFTNISEKTGKRQIFRMSDKGGLPVSLTGDADHDECEPVWSKDGQKIAFVSDRATTPDTKNNYDIWIIDAAHPQQLMQVTHNGSWDDSPTWDPAGKGIFFRSNRGGQWAIWRIDVK